MKLTQLFTTLLFILLLASCGTAKKSSKSSKNFSDSSKNTHVLKSNKNSLDDFANVLGVSKKELKNSKLYFYIDDWLGTPHKMGGLTKSGIDCSGFIVGLYEEIYNEKLPRTSRDMANIVSKKNTKNLNEGDLVFFSFGGKSVDHVGMYLHNNKFVHVSTRKGVIISDLTDIWYGKYVTKSGSVK